MCVASLGSGPVQGLLVHRQCLPVAVRGVGSACSPRPIRDALTLQACHSSWPSPSSVLCTSLCRLPLPPSSFALQGKESFL